jgi:hypothetical protein
LLCGEVLSEYCRALRGHAIGTPTVIGFQSTDKPPTFESSEDLVERAGGQVDSGELLNVLYEGVAVFVTPRETGEYEDGGTGISAKPC